jgi:dUTP pyrophosphatase
MDNENIYGMFLSKNEIKKLVNFRKDKTPLIEDMIDPELQIQPNGVELTVKRIEKFVGPGRIGFLNRDRELSKTEELKFNDDGWIFLKPDAYKIVFNEILNIPLDVIAIAAPRSTLLRCGVTIETAIWDSGYRGRSESLLVVLNKKGYFIRKNARILQLLFIKLVKENAIAEGYKGRYQLENIPPLKRGLKTEEKIY